MYFRCTECAKICENSGASPSGFRPEINHVSTGGGEGAYSSPNPQLLNCNDHTEPSNFREVGGLKKIQG